jgi:hypothetical protein
MATTKPRTMSKPSDLRNRPIKLGPRFLRAFDFAAEKHKGQTRKASTIPYIAHLMGVASIVLEAGGDEELAIAALLHDVVEDCGGAPMLKEIRRRFGARVAKVVEGCTDTDVDPKPPWQERKESYIRHLRKADSDTRWFQPRTNSITCVRFWPTIVRSENLSGRGSTADARVRSGTTEPCVKNFLSANRIGLRVSSIWR